MQQDEKQMWWQEEEEEEEEGTVTKKRQGTVGGGEGNILSTNPQTNPRILHTFVNLLGNLMYVHVTIRASGWE